MSEENLSERDVPLCMQQAGDWQAPNNNGTAIFQIHLTKQFNRQIGFNELHTLFSL